MDFRYIIKSVAKLPIATPDAFILVNISKNITNMLKIEQHVTTSLYVTPLYVMDKCADIETLTCKNESLHSLVTKQSSRRDIFSDTSDSDSGDDQESVDIKDNTFQ